MSQPDPPGIEHNPLIERLRAALLIAQASVMDGALLALYDAAMALVVQYDQQIAYVKYLATLPPPDPALIAEGMRERIEGHVVAAMPPPHEEKP
jgi:hypothetical protein